MDIFKLPAHPSAEIFPMLPDDELEELAADIKANGLQIPLVVATVDGKPMLIDGRNRREACKRAGVTPVTEDLGDRDPNTYILSANIKRRHMTKGAQAMAAALLYPEGVGRGKKDEMSELISLIMSKRYLEQARAVLKFAPEQASAVLAGGIALNAAYDDARKRQALNGSAESRLAKLREKYPDIADMVVEERLTLAGAEAEVSEREEREKQQAYARNMLIKVFKQSGADLLNDPLLAGVVAIEVDQFKKLHASMIEKLEKESNQWAT